MLSILRNESHNNKILTLLDTYEKKIYKISNSNKGKKLILNHLLGKKWYLKILNLQNNTELNSYKKYLFYSEDIIDGRIINYNNSIIKNLKYIYLAIDHYLKVWPKKKIVPRHGDLTLDNIIFKKNKITFIDWENFNLSGSKYGFDIAYLVVSSLILPNIGKIPDKKEFLAANELMNYLLLNGLSEEIFLNPIKFFLNYYKSINISNKKITVFLIEKNKIDFYEKNILFIN